MYRALIPVALLASPVTTWAQSIPLGPVDGGWGWGSSRQQVENTVFARPGWTNAPVPENVPGTTSVRYKAQDGRVLYFAFKDGALINRGFIYPGPKHPEVAQWDAVLAGLAYDAKALRWVGEDGLWYATRRYVDSEVVYQVVLLRLSAAGIE